MQRCKEAGIESVYDIMEMEDDKRNALLKMDGRQMYVACLCLTNMRLFPLIGVTLRRSLILTPHLT